MCVVVVPTSIAMNWATIRSTCSAGMKSRDFIYSPNFTQRPTRTLLVSTVSSAAQSISTFWLVIWTRAADASLPRRSCRGPAQAALHTGQECEACCSRRASSRVAFGNDRPIIPSHTLDQAEDTPGLGRSHRVINDLAFRHRLSGRNNFLPWYHRRLWTIGIHSGCHFSSPFCCGCAALAATG